jgi:hypothetical protein
MRIYFVLSGTFVDVGRRKIASASEILNEGAIRIANLYKEKELQVISLHKRLPPVD